MRPIGLVLAFVLAHSLVLVPLATEAQRQDKIWRIGLIHVGLDHVPPALVSLREELRALGYEDGRNIRLDFRNVANQAAANITAQQFVRDQVDLIVAFRSRRCEASRPRPPRSPWSSCIWWTRSPTGSSRA